MPNCQLCPCRLLFALVQVTHAFALDAELVLRRDLDLDLSVEVICLLLLCCTFASTVPQGIEKLSSFVAEEHMHIPVSSTIMSQSL